MDGRGGDNANSGDFIMVKPKQPRTLSALTKEQVVFVAASLFETQLDHRSKVETLRESLRTRMVEVLECPNVACADGPCNTGVHVFLPSQYIPATEGDVGDFEALLQTSQLDLPVSTPRESPRRDILPAADGQAQQRQLAAAALQTVGLTLEDTIALAANNVPGTVNNAENGAAGGTPHTGTGTRPKTGALRGLLNAFGRTASTPAPTHSLPPTPVVRPPTPVVRPPAPRMAANNTIPQSHTDRGLSLIHI